MRCRCFVVGLILTSLSVPVFAQKPSSATARGEAMIAEYFQRETAKIERSSLAG